MPSVRFLFDFISPYAYLAWTQIHALAQGHGQDVEPVPVLLAAMLNANDTRGPAEIPSKRVYIFKDVLRTAAHLGVPLTPPPAHPFNPLPALRAVALPMSPQTRRSLIDRLFEETWGGGGGVSDLSAVADIAASLGVPDVRQRAVMPQSKQRIRDSTAAAIAAGVFGVPTIEAAAPDGRTELFWGYDSFGHLDRFLGGTDPLDADVLARWADLPATARR